MTEPGLDELLNEEELEVERTRRRQLEAQVKAKDLISYSVIWNGFIINTYTCS